MKVDGLISRIIFGPVDSRRYGRSLGVNPLPAGVKLCSFNCPYCECGWTDVPASREARAELFPTAAEITTALRTVLEQAAAEKLPIDTITFAGNGEPTLHPEFPALIDAALAARNELAPSAGLVALSNSTTLHRPEIVAALSKLDRQVMKLDAGTQECFRRIAMPIEPMSLDSIEANIQKLSRVVLQCMFVQGRVDNTGDEEVAAWLERVKRIQPLSVQIYSLDRKAADYRLEPVPRETLERIAERVRQAGLMAEVF
ncbi:radical SAM protein [Candidatus Sumerlaeota bacterium]|nr:radical SAM protein [Candidatus Sumerlaeota bacterium]